MILEGLDLPSYDTPDTRPHERIDPDDYVTLDRYADD